MSVVNMLKNETPEVLENITKEFGSIEQLYNTVFSLHEKLYKKEISDFDVKAKLDDLTDRFNVLQISFADDLTSMIGDEYSTSLIRNL